MRLKALPKATYIYALQVNIHHTFFIKQGELSTNQKKKENRPEHYTQTSTKKTVLFSFYL
jgi:hypothetical protein